MREEDTVSVGEIESDCFRHRETSPSVGADRISIGVERSGISGQDQGVSSTRGKLVAGTWFRFLFERAGVLGAWLRHPARSKLVFESGELEGIWGKHVESECLFLATDTLSFLNGTSASNIAFGCGLNNGGQGFQGSGLVSLGRGALSLVSQLNEPKFSYCLTPPSSSEISLLLLGSSANKPLAGPFKTTPLVRNPVETSIYYVNLHGISIGGAPLDIPPGTFTTNPNGSGGTIIDSGTTVLILNTTAYSLVNSTLSSLIKLEQVSLPPVTGLGPCWKTPMSNYTFPSFILHLDGADWELPSENYLIEEPSSGATCLAVALSYEYSIIGNIAQHNTLIVYDLVKETLSFAPADCSGI
ncbi:hypothetical protein Droror1_Dr00023792 [Drosera rotundifolia]